MVVLKPLHGRQILTSEMSKTEAWDVGQALCVKKCCT